MKRVFLILCILSLFISGCNNKASEDEKITAYSSVYKAVMDNGKWQSTSKYFSLSAEMSELPDGKYNYYIFIDTPAIALYDIKTIAVEDGLIYGETQKMMPTMGVFEKVSYSMVPNQVNADEGFVKGLVISGQVDKPSVDIKMMVSWNNIARNQLSREFFAFTITMDGVTYPEDNVVANEIAPIVTPEVIPEATPEITPIASVEPSNKNDAPEAIIPSEVTFPNYSELSTPLPSGETGYIEGAVFF